MDSIENFLEKQDPWHGDIVTNPPYKLALPCVKKALELIPEGAKVAMFLKTLFLESAQRGRFFLECPPKTVWVSSKRLNCCKNGDMTALSKIVSYSWFIWEKGFEGNTELKWFNM